MFSDVGTPLKGNSIQANGWNDRVEKFQLVNPPIVDWTLFPPSDARFQDGMFLLVKTRQIGVHLIQDGFANGWRLPTIPKRDERGDGFQETLRNPGSLCDYCDNITHYVPAFPHGHLLRFGDPVLELPHTRMWPQHGISKIDFFGTDSRYAPFYDVVVKHLYPMMQNLWC
jgi:hypothetical protein